MVWRLAMQTVWHGQWANKWEMSVIKGQRRKDMHGVHACGRCMGKKVWFDCARESVGQWASREDGLAEVFGGLLSVGGLAGQVWAIGP